MTYRLPRRHRSGLQSVGLLVLALGLFLVGHETTRAEEGEDWAFLDNGTLRLGVLKSSGGAIAYLSPSVSKRNLLNHFDRGRLIQQSYYGDPDGSLWVQQPWRWNPVQGGDYKGTASTLLEFHAEPNRLHARARPRNWAACSDVPEVVMETDVTLDGNIVHVHFRMTYDGKTHHAPADQEVPALFVEPELDTLVLYDGDAPWTKASPSRSRPGWPNESRRMTEHWAAYVNKDDQGLGIFVPMANRLTCYRYADRHSSKEGACSYLAPLTHFAIVPGLDFAYDLDLTVGSVDQIRGTFARIHESAARNHP